MNSITMNRLELLGIVKSNLEKHKLDYIESVKDYETAVLTVAADNVKITKANQKALAKKIDLQAIKGTKSFPHAPRSYAAEYARAVRMLELSVDENIEIEEDIFNQLVLDEWSWKRDFIAASTMYKTMSGAL